MTLKQIKKNVCEQNKRLAQLGLVILTEGNVSQISDDGKYMVIKPSGIPYEDLIAEKMVVVDLKRGTFTGKLRPSSDTPTHVEIYKKCKGIRGIAHTHSVYATAWSQTAKPLPCYGTTHADSFYGPVPITRLLTNTEILNDYELNTGKVIVEALQENKVSGIL